MSNAEQKRNRRRRVLPGFPFETKFTTPESLADYFGDGNNITCLRCGRKYRKLGFHLLKIHEMEPDEYREIYGIPWTYGLDCSETTELASENMRERIASGIIVPSRDIYKKAIAAERKPRQPVRDVLTARNLAKMNAGKDGTRQPDKRRDFMARRGTPEFKEKMRNRPQMEKAKELLRTYWKGKKQTDEHVFNRTGFHKKA